MKESANLGGNATSSAATSSAAVQQFSNAKLSALPDASPGSTQLGPEVREFLDAVADTHTKLHVLEFFLLHSGICVSSGQLATRLDISQEAVREALRPLHDEGVLTYCPYFGNADLCLMNANYHTTAMKQHLSRLKKAMDEDASAVWAHIGPDYEPATA